MSLMATRRRLPQAESRLAALEAARVLLIEAGPHSVTLKAVAAQVDRTHANLLHHFGSVAELHRELARHMARTICARIGEAVLASRRGAATARDIVDLAFEAFGRDGGGVLAAWLRLADDPAAMQTVVEAIHELVEQLHEGGSDQLRETTLTLVLLALGDSLIGAPLASALGVDRGTVRLLAEGIVVRSQQAIK